MTKLAFAQSEPESNAMPATNDRTIILFDWDGTLVNSLDLKVRHAGLVFSRSYAVSPAEVEASYRRHSGIPRRQLFAAIYHDLGLGNLNDDQFTRLSAQFSDLNRRVLTDPSTPGLLPADTIPALEQLCQMGVTLYVSSSAETGELREVAQALGLAPYFLNSGGEILGSQPGLNKGPEHVRYIRERHAPSPVRLLAVGDEPSDIRLARQAGITAVAKVGTYSRAWWQQATLAPDYLIETLAELPEVLPEIQGSADMEQFY